MSEGNEKLKKFIDSVNDDIDERVAQLLEEAEEEKQEILASAEEASRSNAENHYDLKKRKTDSGYVKELSKSEFELKKNVLRRRTELTDSVFEAVKERIKEYRKTVSYADGLVRALLLLNVSGKAEIRLAPEDMKYADALSKAVRSEDVTFVGDSSITLGGFSVYIPEKSIIIDKTFDMALEEQRKAFVGRNAFAK